jgi:hypothetical protein
MPVEFAELITPEMYHYLMGLSGIASAFVVLLIWSQGL